jgi:aryl-alcohol dehydrogenase-like predicted oxidoreductase
MSKLILGTVQLGLPYGINNQSGMPSVDEAQLILGLAEEGGIQYLDTAAAYGNSELVIGSYFQKKPYSHLKVISKFHLHEGLSAEDSLRNSLEKLNVNSIDTLLFHSFSDYQNNNNQKLALKHLKGLGLIKNMGVSVYTNEELEIVINDSDIETIQLPFNVLDNDSRKGVLLNRAKELGKTIHVRSVFLQGLFYKSIEDLPEKLIPLTSYLQIFKNICKESGLSIAELALAYAINKNYIDGVLIGVDTPKQLSENLLASQITTPKEVEMRIDEISVSEIQLLNPVNWNK